MSIGTISFLLALIAATTILATLFDTGWRVFTLLIEELNQDLRNELNLSNSLDQEIVIDTFIEKSPSLFKSRFRHNCNSTCTYLRSGKARED